MSNSSKGPFYGSLRNPDPTKVSEKDLRESLDSAVRKAVLKALEDPQSDWHTAQGVARDTGLSEQDVLQIIESSPDEVIRSPYPDPEGRALYTTRPHYTTRRTLISRFPCPYLKGDVELSEERERHVAERHPDLLPEHRQRVAEVLADPDQVRRSVRFGSARLFSRWYTDVQRGKHVVVVVVSEFTRERHWIITAYMTRKLAEGEVEWRRG